MNVMKKTVLSMAVLAIIVSVAVSACSKDDANVVKATPRVGTQTTNSWSQDALTNGNDTYYYNYEGQRVSVERVDSMLSIRCSTRDNLNGLPGNFVVLESEDCTRPYRNTNECKALVLFSGTDRSVAIETLKQIDGIFCIEPVYKNQYNSVGDYKQGNGWFALRVSCAEDTVAIRRFADTIHCEMYTDQYVWQWAQQYADFDYGSIPVLLWMDHSVVNSVVAGNMLVESGRALGTYSSY